MYMSPSQTIVITGQVEWKSPPHLSEKHCSKEFGEHKNDTSYSG